MADYDASKFGGVLMPLAPGDADDSDLLREADPSVFFARDFFAHCIRKYIGPRLAKEAERTGAKIPEAVHGLTSVDPGTFLYANPSFKYPLLAVYRISSRFKYRTTNWLGQSGKWGVSYILPPLNPDSIIRLTPILHAIELLLATKTEQGWDPGYKPPGIFVDDDGNQIAKSAGDQPWDLKSAGLDAIYFGEDDDDGTSYGVYEGSSSGLLHLGLRAKLVVLERRMPTPGGSPFAGADINADLQPTDGGAIVTDIVVVQTKAAPTVTLVTPSSGPAAGGTAITVLGTNFEPGAKVTVGGQPCTSVNVSAANTLTAITRAHPVGAADIVVTNPDSQSGSLASAFTYV